MDMACAMGRKLECRARKVVMKRKPCIWIKVELDEYELPVAVAGSAAELARICGEKETTIRAGAFHYAGQGRKSPFRRVVIEEERQEE